MEIKVYSIECKDTTEVYIMNSDGTGKYHLCSVASMINEIVWSPDSTMIAYIVDDDGGSDI